jgi:hypothetical protein
MTRSLSSIKKVRTSILEIGLSRQGLMKGSVRLFMAVQTRLATQVRMAASVSGLILVMLLGTHRLQAQQRIEMRPVDVPRFAVPEVILNEGMRGNENRFGGAGANNNLDLLMQLGKRKEQLFRVVRGLLQNELSSIDTLCGLDDLQKQKLVDLVEMEWKVKANPSVEKAAQQHVFGTIDLDGIGERFVRAWLSTLANPEQLSIYDAELADRMEYRRQAVVSQLLDTLHTKLNLSSKQMVEIEKVLNTNWRDRWFRSLEATFNNTALLPEVRPSWISAILTESQRAALVSRETQSSYRAYPITSNSPMMELTQRFSVGRVTSSDAVELKSRVRKDGDPLGILEQTDAPK